jgi:hypothetical protein
MQICWLPEAAACTARMENRRGLLIRFRLEAKGSVQISGWEDYSAIWLGHCSGVSVDLVLDLVLARHCADQRHIAIGHGRWRASIRMVSLIRYSGLRLVSM